MSRVYGQELRPEDSAACADAITDLIWLAAHEALPGVAEIIRERRRQIEQLKYTAEHDDDQDNGWLMHTAAQRIIESMGRTLEGTEGHPETEEALRQSGALAAAEIDRLLRMVTPGKQVITVTALLRGRVLDGPANPGTPMLPPDVSLRCLECGRLAGMPTAPCPACADRERGGTQ